jgi:hypothetical protein
MVEQVEGEAFWLARRALQMNSERKSAQLLQRTAKVVVVGTDEVVEVARKHRLPSGVCHMRKSARLAPANRRRGASPYGPFFDSAGIDSL